MANLLRNSRLAQTTLAALFAISLIPLAIYGSAAPAIRYMADDYCTIAGARASGVFSNVAAYYQSWIGTYSAIFVVGLQGILGLGIEPVLLLFAGGCYWALLYRFLRQIVFGYEPSFPALKSAIAASVVCAASIAGISSPAQTFYWPTGRAPYFLSVVLILLYFDLARSRWAQRAPGQIGAALLAFVIGGFNSAYTPGFLVLQGVAWLLPHFRDGKRFLVSGTLGSLAGLAVLAAAPGNAVRQSHFPPPDLGYAIPAAITAVGAPGVVATILAPVAILPVFAVPFLWIDRRKADAGPAALWPSLLILVGAAMAIVAMFLPAFYAMSVSLPGRAWLLPLLLTLWAGGTVGSLAGRMVWRRLGNERFALARWGLIVALIVVSTISGIDHAVRQRHALIDYAARWDARHALLENAAAGGVLDVAVPPMAETFGLDDVSDDSSFWVNQCMAGFYNLETVRRQ